MQPGENMNQIEEKSLKLAEECAQKLKLRIIEVEYVFENGIKILRVITDGENGLSLDDATKLNEMLSARLDEEDFIDEEYYLEVSSEGIEKELRNDEDIKKAIGKYVFIKMYEKVDGIKEIYGDLIDFDGDILDVNYLIKNKKKNIKIQKSKISKIRLAVKF